MNSIVEFLGLEAAQIEAALKNGVPDCFVVAVDGMYINFGDVCSQARPMTASRFDTRSDAYAQGLSSFGGRAQPVPLDVALSLELAHVRRLMEVADHE